MRFRITIILMLALGGLTAISVGTVLFVSSAASVKNTLELMRAQARVTIAGIERGVADHVAPAHNLVAELRRRVADGSLDISDRARMAEVLSGALAPVPQLGGVVVWQRGGSGLWVMRHADGRISVETEANPDNAEFTAFIADIAARDTIRWGEPYFREGLTYITISATLLRDGERIGAVATGVSLIELSRFVHHELTSAAATAFVLYGEDKALAHPAMLEAGYAARLSAERPVLSITEIGDAVLAQFPDLPAADLPSEEEFEVRETGALGEGHVILSRAMQAFGSVPWTVGVHIPIAEIGQQFRRLIGSIGIGLGLLVLSVAAALVLARRIARPVRAVSAAAEKIARLDLDTIEELPRSRIRELDEQARSFNSMVRGLRWFRTYVPHQLVRRLMESADGISTGAREANLTVMFTDIAGFTPLSESMPPAAVAEMLNRHFEMLIASIESEGGTVDKFIGDATMAFWGAPEPVPDHAARACRAALAIARAIEAHHARGEDRDVRVKIALHTGPLIVGNIGAEARMNYTVIGDTVNVCARIESLTGQFTEGRAATILVSSDVVAAAGDGFRFAPIGDHAVKGRARTVEIWRLLGEA